MKKPLTKEREKKTDTLKILIIQLEVTLKLYCTNYSKIVNEKIRLKKMHLKKSLERERARVWVRIWIKILSNHSLFFVSSKNAFFIGEHFFLPHLIVTGTTGSKWRVPLAKQNSSFEVLNVVKVRALLSFYVKSFYALTWPRKSTSVSFRGETDAKIKLTLFALSWLNVS